MNNIFLCGNTGTLNRGCEAIIRSSVKVLGARSGDIYLATFAPGQDAGMAKELGINMLSYNQYPSSLHRYFYGGLRKLTGNDEIGHGIIQKPIFTRITRDDLCLNIGGDTYCYGRPTTSYALNNYTSKKGIDNILWCCSIDGERIKGDMLVDLKKYKYIFAREILTYNYLIEAGIPADKVIKCCDPAFFLDVKQVELPKGFVVKNTVGINVSEITVNDKYPHVYSNVIALIRHILDNTDMSVCLIPHVYSIKKNKNDYPILKKIYEDINDPRISIVDKEYTCEELKYIISNCRFFIGARTHATIAAYSTGVPTLVIGYSVKSKGIATDLFGKYEGYVLPYKELTEKNELLNAFLDIAAREQEIIERLQTFLPMYRKELADAVEKYLPIKKDKKSFEICAKELCTGCSACAGVCPVGAVTMTRDDEGFEYPVIDREKCISCHRCLDVCSVANRAKDSGRVPKAYSCINKEGSIRLSSSSGGVFSALAKWVIAEGGVVFGAGYTSDMEVEHMMCDTLEAVELLRGSKYVQSRIGNTYNEAKKYLEKGRRVLFSGTPCQINGLYSFLCKDYDNLFTVDFICHGVPSPKAWRKYLSQREKIAGAKATSVCFRHKHSGWRTYSVHIDFDNGSSYDAVNSKDLYIKGFLTNLYLRPSCGICSAKNTGRRSDITLGDHWGIGADSPFNDDKGTSVVMLHSDKGAHLFGEIGQSLNAEEISFSSAVKHNSSYSRSSAHSPFRSLFFKSIKKSGFDKSVTKYYGGGFVPKIRRAIKKFTR